MGDKKLSAENFTTENKSKFEGKPSHEKVNNEEYMKRTFKSNFHFGKNKSKDHYDTIYKKSTKERNLKEAENKPKDGSLYKTNFLMGTNRTSYDSENKNR